MLDFLRSLKRKKEEKFLLLDVGSEAVKTLFFQQKGEKIRIFGNSFEYYNEDAFEVWTGSSSGFGREILKKAILGSLQNSGFQSKKIGKDWQVIAGLPADIFRARAVFQNFQRKDPKLKIEEKEKTAIIREVLDKTKKSVARIFSQKSGILPQDIAFIDLEILETKIDGYPVPVIEGYEGRNLDFRILATFLPQYYLKEFKIIAAELGFKNFKMTCGIKGLGAYFKERADEILLDIGGALTQIVRARAGKIEEIGEFKTGGRDFSSALGERLGLLEPEARLLKERYSKKELSKESLERIKEIFSFPSQIWFKNLKLKLGKMSRNNLLASNFSLFGGGSLLPEIKEILSQGDWGDLSFAGKPRIEILSPKTFIERLSAGGFKNLRLPLEHLKNLNNPQDTPLLFLYFLALNTAGGSPQIYSSQIKGGSFG